MEHLCCFLTARQDFAFDRYGDSRCRPGYSSLKHAVSCVNPALLAAHHHRNQQPSEQPPNDLGLSDFERPIQFKLFILLVPGGGVEPPWPQGPADFESAASASSAIPARGGCSASIAQCLRWMPQSLRRAEARFDASERRNTPPDWWKLRAFLDQRPPRSQAAHFPWHSTGFAMGLKRVRALLSTRRSSLLRARPMRQ